MSPSTRFLILSDTHEGSHPWPYTATRPSPRADVLLHCGDLTQVGGLSAFKKAMNNIRAMDAEIKLVIAGNHDLELDEKWVREHPNEVDIDKHRECVAYMKSLESEGVYCLEEGTHTFRLKDGKVFSVYASSYTPAFNDFAFAYGENEDRFNHGANPVPNNVDIVLSHGPPALPKHAGYNLDAAADGRHCGCEKLAKAVRRAQPKVHCFGHMHEGRGATKMGWADDRLKELIVEREDGFEVVQVEKIGKGETVLVNAAMFEDGKEWIADMDL